MCPMTAGTEKSPANVVETNGCKLYSFSERRKGTIGCKPRSVNKKKKKRPNGLEKEHVFSQTPQHQAFAGDCVQRVNVRKEFAVSQKVRWTEKRQQQQIAVIASHSKGADHDHCGI
mmetsp:Transcript_2728/g.3764  ORF Transcript_2728/g.3764 Transcript_2728/m.3764 type:complete len:116 (-) Transcript_2728:328-675(-)